MKPPATMARLAPPCAAATPYRNSTTSEPSRSTATATTAPSAASDFEPATTASPAARNSAAISRPWRAIQTLCQVSINTAKPRMEALKISWPLPPNSSDRPPVNTATTQAPSTPAVTPPRIQAPRPGTPAVTAMTMPTISPASKTSRKTIRSAASTGTSWYDQGALCLMVEVVDKIVAARLLRPHMDDRFAAGRDDLLEMQFAAFESEGDVTEVLDPNIERLAGRRVQFGGIELVI